MVSISVVRGGDSGGGHRRRGRTRDAARRGMIIGDLLLLLRLWLLLLLLMSDAPGNHGFGANFFVGGLSYDTAFHELIAQSFAPCPLPAIGSVDHHEDVDVRDAGELHGGFQENINEERLHALSLLDDAQKAGGLNGSRVSGSHGWM